MEGNYDLVKFSLYRQVVVGANKNSFLRPDEKSKLGVHKELLTFGLLYQNYSGTSNIYFNLKRKTKKLVVITYLSTLFVI